MIVQKNYCFAGEFCEGGYEYFHWKCSCWHSWHLYGYQQTRRILPFHQRTESWREDREKCSGRITETLQTSFFPGQGGILNYYGEADINIIQCCHIGVYI